MLNDVFGHDKCKFVDFLNVDCEILVDEWRLNMRLDFGLIMVMMMILGLIS